MLQEEGTVVSLDGEAAMVRKPEAGACHGCPQQGSCAATAVCDRQETLVRVKNTLGARPGDRVVLDIDQPSPALKPALYVIVPLLALVAGGSLGRLLGGHSCPGAPPAAGVAGLLLAICGLKAYFRHRKRQHRPPAMKKIIARQGH